MAGVGLLLGLLLAPAAGLTAEREAAVSKAITDAMSERSIPGVSAAVARGGEIVFAEGFGKADLENDVPVTADTMFRLASVSKSFTAVLAMQLAEAGLLDLDGDVRRYVPAFPKKAWPTTARQLLGHLGGIRHYAGEEFGADPVDGRAFEENGRPYATLLEGLDLFKDDPRVAEPGTEYHYTTHGYTLLGCALEAASGRRFLELLRERIGGPAGLTATRDDDARALIQHRAQGYVRAADGQLRNAELADVSYKVPGGGLISTASDVARFGAALLAGRLVRAQTRDAMFTEQKARDGKPTGYGLGFDIRTVDSRREVSHTGGQARVSTVLYMLPDQDLVVVLLSNLENAGLRDVARQAGRSVRP